jgi:hypothetical protein
VLKDVTNVVLSMELRKLKAALLLKAVRNNSNW